jgi:hypothetical protein
VPRPTWLTGLTEDPESEILSMLLITDRGECEMASLSTDR